ncbi:MAG: TonB family protein [Candidatus Sulfotelmatobacter sp.]|jgi:TonB family protein
MFAQLNAGTSTRRRRVLAGSLTLHALLFLWLLHRPEPQLLNAASVSFGRNGNVVTQLYFPTQSPDNSTTTSSDRASEVYRHQRLGHEKLVLKRNPALAKLPLPQLPLSSSPAEDNAKTTTLSKAGHGAPAGLPYGSLPGGPIYGDEIRPALPITTSDPVVYPWQRPDSEGKVVIEITIDERGEIVRKTVLQSLGPAIDNQCLAALENWHFQPATHNGIPIPSKQDAIFPFKARV